MPYRSSFRAEARYLVRRIRLRSWARDRTPGHRSVNMLRQRPDSEYTRRVQAQRVLLQFRNQ